MQLRPATVDDAAAIAALKRLVWPTEVTALEQVQGALQAPGHAVFVAVQTGAVLGFVDAFATRSSRGVPRWEIDLLAVHPEQRGRGLGQQLVWAATAAGRRCGAALARALVRVENVASQTVFARCGYTPDAVVSHLYVSVQSQRVNDALSALRDWHAVPVHTLSYHGLWLETPAAGAWPPADPAGDVWELVGAVIPADQAAHGAEARAVGLQKMGEYRWWIRALGGLSSERQMGRYSDQ